MTLCVESLKMFERHFASFKWQKLSVISRGMPVAHHLKSEQLQSPLIGLRKISIDYFFFQADQWDCTKSLSTFNQFASSERFGTCQICPLSVSHSKVTTPCEPAKSFGMLASHWKQPSRPRPNYFFQFWVFPIMILFRLGLAFS